MLGGRGISGVVLGTIESAEQFKDADVFTRDQLNLGPAENGIALVVLVDMLTELERLPHYLRECIGMEQCPKLSMVRLIAKVPLTELDLLDRGESLIG